MGTEKLKFVLGAEVWSWIQSDSRNRVNETAGLIYISIIEGKEAFEKASGLECS